MKIIKFFCVILLCTLTTIVDAQNLLSTSSWSIGSGSVTGFSQNGSTLENNREWGVNHIGESIVLWKASPDSNSDADGGWNSTYQSIDNTKKYRLSVWIKKTNSNDGNTYFGCQQWQGDQNINPYTILNLNNTVNTNPYFWVGDLPILDRWYLLVGYIHGKSDTSTISQGAIYDGVTGELVQNITDFKFNSSTSLIRHRAYLYYDTNTSDRQYFCSPRMEIVNGNEWSLNKLLGINPNSSLIFAYDNAGSQKQRFYCPDAGCSVSSPPAGKTTGDKNAVSEENNVDAANQNGLNDYDGQLIMYPNPTKDIVFIKIKSELLSKIESVRIFNVNSTLIETLKAIDPNEKLKVDLTGKPTGVYFLHIHLNDGSNSITRKIVKD